MYLDKLMSINGDGLEESPFEKEVFLEGFLLERVNHICPPWAEPTGKVVNQIVLPNGRIDIAFELTNNEGWALAELKKKRLEWGDLQQLVDYMCQKTNLLNSVRASLGADGEPALEVTEPSSDLSNSKLIGVLVGPSIDPDLAHAIMLNKWRVSGGVTASNGCKLDELEIGAAVVNRFRDLASKAGRGWSNYFVFSDRYFSLQKPDGTPNGKDYSKFSFDNQLTWHGAGRFVYEYVLSYCSNNPAISVGNLLERFPATFQGSIGVISTINSPSSRYFKEPISVGSSQVFVCNQWGYAHGSGNLAGFIQKIKNDPFYANVWRRQPGGAAPVIV